MRFTEIGRSVSIAIDASKWAEKQTERLAREIADILACDIQALAFQYAEGFEYDRDMDVRIKQCAYENGIRGVSLDPTSDPTSPASSVNHSPEHHSPELSREAAEGGGKRTPPRARWLESFS